MVKGLPVASTADSVAHTCTALSPSSTLSIAGTDTVTSSEAENPPELLKNVNYMPNHRRL